MARSLGLVGLFAIGCVCAVSANANAQGMSAVFATPQSTVSADESSYLPENSPVPDSTVDASRRFQIALEARLQQAELNIPIPSTGRTEAAKDIALLTLEVEEMRNRYATALELYAEGIKPPSYALTARAAYEKVQVQIAGKKGLVSESMAAIHRQREIATGLVNHYRRELAEAGQLPL